MTRRPGMYVLSFFLLVFACLGCLRKNSEKSWDMINVNAGDQQGDSHLIRGSQKTILLDAGSACYAKTQLLPFLRKRGVHRIDALIVTHPHSGHYGGVLDILRSPIKVEKLYIRPASKEWMTREFWGGKPEDLDEIIKVAKEKGVSIHDLSELTTIELGDDFIFEKLFAFTEDELKKMGIGPDINELSLIAMLRSKNNSVLFTGDLNRALSAKLIEKYPEKFKCDILKVPHHGAEGFATDEFIKSTNAKFFMFPTPFELWQTPRCERGLRLAREMKAGVFVNGVNRTVSVVFNDDGFKFDPEMNRCLQ